MIFRTVLTTLFLTLCLGMDAQANESPKQASIFALQPFERAICCIKSIVRRIILMLAMATS